MYSSRQIQCMQAIGLVPWVRRSAQPASADELSQPATQFNSQINTSVSSQASTGANQYSVVYTGDIDSAVLLIFDTHDGATSWPLSPADDALLEGMLRAIGMTKAAVCSCALVPTSTLVPTANTGSLQTLCCAPRKRFLYFGGDTIAENTVEPVPMKQAAVGTPLAGWRLPTLSALRQAPQRKRQAWMTLKQLRSALD